MPNLFVPLLLAALFTDAPALAAGTLTPFDQRPDAIEFNLQDSLGNRVALSDYRGQVLVINFWATWCPPCRKEMPSMNRGNAWLKPYNAQFIAINMGEPGQRVARFLKQTPMDFPVLLDPDMKVSNQWGVKGLPVTYVVDPAGRLAYVAEGVREWDDPALLVPIRALALER